MPDSSPRARSGISSPSAPPSCGYAYALAGRHSSKRLPAGRGDDLSPPARPIRARSTRAGSSTSWPTATARRSRPPTAPVAQAPSLRARLPRRSCDGGLPDRHHRCPRLAGGLLARRRRTLPTGPGAGWPSCRWTTTAARWMQRSAGTLPTGRGRKPDCSSTPKAPPACACRWPICPPRRCAAP